MATATDRLGDERGFADGAYGLGNGMADRRRVEAGPDGRTMAGSASLAGGSDGYPKRPLEILGSVLNNLTAVVLITVITLIFGLSAVMLKIKPTYSTQAVLKIEPVLPTILRGTEETPILIYYDDFVNTQMAIVKSYPILSKAIEFYKEQGFDWQFPGESLEQAVGRLEGRLDVSQMRNTHLFSIAMYGRRKEGLAELINAVTVTYLAANKDEQLNRDSSRLTFLKKKKQDIEDALGRSYSILQKMSSKYAVGITNEKNIYVYLQAIVDLTQQLVKGTAYRIEIESKLQELQSQMERLQSVDISADVDEWIENDWAIRDNRIQISRKLQNMNQVLTGVNPEHPDRQDYENSLNNLYDLQDNLIERSRKVGEQVLRGKLISDQRKKILDLETEYTAALNTEKKLYSALEEAEQKATSVNTQMMKAATLHKDIQRLQDALLRIHERIDQIELESRAEGRITLKTGARTPETPNRGKRMKALGVVILFSLFSGIGFAVFKTKLDPRIHTTNDVERVLGFSATGYILDAGQDEESVEDYYRAVMDHPFSQLAEEYKEISFSLSIEHEMHKSRIFTGVSLGKGHGTSSFLINTLCSLKTGRRKKIFVDLNPWNPICAKLLPKETAGLWEVLEGECDLNDVIVTESDYPFHILPFGNWKMREKSLFQELGMDSIIESLRLDYEYIMIDSPPLMITTSSKFLARLADVVILLVNAEDDKEKELFRAVKALDRLDVQVISVVLNRVKLLRGKYYKSVMKDYYSLTSGINEEGSK